MKLFPLPINSLKTADHSMREIGTDVLGKKIMAPKMLFRVYKIEGISSYAANIIKQHLLSLGSDAALSRDCLVKKMNTDIIIFGTVSQLRKFIEKIKYQPFGLKEVAQQLDGFLRTNEEHPFFRARNKKLSIDKPVICGIINVTPDSFSGDGVLAGRRGNIEKNTLEQVAQMIKNKAKMIDIGAESTRPLAKKISQAEELRRLIPLVKAIRRRFPKVILSVDSYKYEVVKAAIEEGIDVVNDITALRSSPRICDLVVKYKLGCILMHMKGTPRTMQKNPVYRDVVKEVREFLARRIDFCLKGGVKRNQLMIDPGIGFGKRLQDNIAIIRSLNELKGLGVPLFLGVSRKSFIGNILGVDATERLSGTVASCLISLLNGANVLRVHDVRQINQAVHMSEVLINQ